jgi:ketosteroid isomerase-like protein
MINGNGTTLAPGQYAVKFGKYSSNPAEIVRQYYKDIDQNDLDAVMSLFAEDATYQRTAWDELKGKEQIEHFYRTQREIRGKHKLSSVVVNPKKPKAVFVEGHFSGHKAEQPVHAKFTDVWVLNAENRVSARTSTIETTGRI